MSVHGFKNVHCPSYREYSYSKMIEKRQGPTPGFRLREKLFKRELTDSTFFCKLPFLLLLTTFHVSVPLFSDRSQMMSTCGKNKEEAHEPQVSVSLVFLLNILWFLHFSYLKTAPAKVFSRLSLA